MTPEQAKKFENLLKQLTFQSENCGSALKENWWNDFVLKMISKVVPQMPIEELGYQLMLEQVRRKYGEIPPEKDINLFK
jgi:hypothetical protein